jgi:hypothetical protein
VAVLPPAVADLPPLVASLPPAVAVLPPAVADLPPAVANLPPVLANLPPLVADLPPLGVSLPPLVANLPPLVASLPPAVADFRPQWRTYRPQWRASVKPANLVSPRLRKSPAGISQKIESWGLDFFRRRGCMIPLPIGGEVSAAGTGLFENSNRRGAGSPTAPPASELPHPRQRLRQS